MSNTYIEYRFVIKPAIPGNEILIAELSEIGFESFNETAENVLAYIPKNKDSKGLLDHIQVLNSKEFESHYSTQTIAEKNWNEEWEKQFKPIEIDKECRIRSSFHVKKKVKYDILIDPKMAFGTGHHSTTHLMLSYLLSEEVENKKILDMGCGTGVLAILASMRNAQSIDAIDIDPWSYENTLENIKLNDCENISVFEGDAGLLKGEKYDLILANINRNILLNDMKTYTKSLSKNGTLIMSGFYEKDLPLIKKEGQKNGLEYLEHQLRNDWVAVKMELK